MAKRWLFNGAKHFSIILSTASWLHTCNDFKEDGQVKFVMSSIGCWIVDCFARKQPSYKDHSNHYRTPFDLDSSPLWRGWSKHEIPSVPAPNFTQPKLTRERECKSLPQVILGMPHSLLLFTSMCLILAMRHFWLELPLKLPALSQEAHDEAPSLAGAMEVFYMYAVNILFDNSKEKNNIANAIKLFWTLLLLRNGCWQQL